MTTTLSSPLELPCGVVLRNRLVKAAMSEQLARRDGTPSDRLRRLYAVWAGSGAAVLITGNAMVSRDALTEPGNVILDDDRALDAVRSWSAAAQQGGAQVWMQVNHPGKVAVTPFDRRPVAPTARRSAVPGYNIRKPRELTPADIADLVQRFARTAELAVAGGFDGVQVHAAHGYLLSQFLSPLHNRRDDAWGGDAERRRRLLLDVVGAVRARVGDGVPVSVKLNSRDFVHGGFEEGEALDVALALADAGVDLLEVSGGGYEQPAMTGVARGQDRAEEGYFTGFAAAVSARTTMPVLLTGGLRSPQRMAELLASGAIDAVGLGRPMAFVPDYPRRLLAGEQPALPPAPRRCGVRALDGFVGLAMSYGQIHRIAAGRTPERRPGALTVARSGARIARGALQQVTVPD
ncbi:NADH:flavin oxidoreductase [Nocardioides sp. LML1-1-1.1]|uniref:oxidoreductase n=1 Tax=Nocardioides sp. LML1-1-1.1 TaxID=3135248 RepID=UPI003419B675